MQNLFKIKSFKNIVPRSVIESGGHNLKFPLNTSPSSDYYTADADRIVNLPIHALSAIGYDLTWNLKRMEAILASKPKDSAFVSALNAKANKTSELLQAYRASTQLFLKKTNPSFPIKTAVELIYVEAKGGANVNELYEPFKGLIASKFNYLSLQSCVDLLEIISMAKGFSDAELIKRLSEKIEKEKEYLNAQKVEFDAWTTDIYKYSNSKEEQNLFEEFNNNSRKSLLSSKVKFYIKLYTLSPFMTAVNFFLKRFSWTEYEQFFEPRVYETKQQLEEIESNLLKNYSALKIEFKDSKV